MEKATLDKYGLFHGAGNHDFVKGGFPIATIELPRIFPVWYL